MALPFARRRGRFGRYHVVRVLHEGDKSKVFLAASPEQPGESVAIKFYKWDYDRAARELEKKYSIPSEAEVGLKFNPPPEADPARHPVVVTLGGGHEFGRRHRCRYIVLEYVEGVALRSLISCRDRRVVQFPRAFVVQCCQALRIIHRAGFVFRDFGAQNVIVRPDNRLKLIDLGFAAPAGMAFRECSGTPTYMAPEQIEARELSPATDIYALGVLIYELLIGRPPYVSSVRGEDEASQEAQRREVMQKHLEEPVPQLPEIVRQRRPALGAVMTRCLQKDPAERYQDVGEIIRTVVSRT